MFRNIEVPDRSAARLLRVGVMDALLLNDFGAVNNLLDEMDGPMIRDFQQLVLSLAEAVDSHAKDKDN